MTQAISPVTLLVHLTSMSPLETLAAAPTALRGGGTEQTLTNSLLLHPGELGEISVRLENPSDRPLRWQLAVSGNFPPVWSRWQQEELIELLPKQTTEVTLPFKVPEEFFEHQEALGQGKIRLQLDYQSEIEIHEVSGSALRPVTYQVFNLHVRPRTSYLDFLPAFYREIDFFERFLSIFEQTFDPYVQTIDTLWAYLDPLTAPPSLLPFLAHWVAWRLEPDWNLENQRQLIRNALELYRWHGTRRGLRLYLSLYTGLDEERISIEEVFGGGFTFGDCRLGENSIFGGGRPYHFIVQLRPEYPNQSINEQLVRTVIEREKPPFCTYDLDILAV